MPLVAPRGRAMPDAETRPRPYRQPGTALVDSAVAGLTGAGAGAAPAAGTATAAPARPPAPQYPELPVWLDPTMVNRSDTSPEGQARLRTALEVGPEFTAIRQGTEARESAIDAAIAELLENQTYTTEQARQRNALAFGRRSPEAIFSGGAVLAGLQNTLEERLARIFAPRVQSLESEKLLAREQGIEQLQQLLGGAGSRTAATMGDIEAAQAEQALELQKLQSLDSYRQTLLSLREQGMINDQEYRAATLAIDRARVAVERDRLAETERHNQELEGISRDRITQEGLQFDAATRRSFTLKFGPESADLLMQAEDAAAAGDEATAQELRGEAIARAKTFMGENLGSGNNSAAWKGAMSDLNRLDQNILYGQVGQDQVPGVVDAVIQAWVPNMTEDEAAALETYLDARGWLTEEGE